MQYSECSALDFTVYFYDFFSFHSKVICPFRRINCDLNQGQYFSAQGPCLISKTEKRTRSIVDDEKKTKIKTINMCM